jgi:hypothetical protein
MRRIELKMMLVCILILLAGTGPSALGDWDEGGPHKMHYPQLPDLSDAGMDVLTGPRLPEIDGMWHEKFLADDFACSRSGPITGIHIWGSYNEDIRLIPDPYFNLVIYENMPADPCYPFSRPGQVLWHAYMAPVAERVYAQNLNEAFYDPNPNLIVGWDTQAWQFNFMIDPCEAFVQEQGEIYWLGVHHTYDLNHDNVVNLADLLMLKNAWPGCFGWKTSGVEQFEDNAVWTEAGTFGATPPYVAPEGEIWAPLFYPDGHAYEMQSIDLAFVINGPDPNIGTCWDPLECPCQPRGDATCNGMIDLADLFALKAHFGKCAPWTAPECCSDYDHDGCVNLLNLFILKSNWGFGCPGGASTGNQTCPP